MVSIPSCLGRVRAQQNLDRVGRRARRCGGARRRLVGVAARPVGAAHCADGQQHQQNPHRTARADVNALRPRGHARRAGAGRARSYDSPMSEAPSRRRLRALAWMLVAAVGLFMTHRRRLQRRSRGSCTRRGSIRRIRCAPGESGRCFSRPARPRRTGRRRRARRPLRRRPAGRWTSTWRPTRRPPPGPASGSRAGTAPSCRCSTRAASAATTRSGGRVGGTPYGLGAAAFGVLALGFALGFAPLIAHARESASRRSARR